MKKFLISLVLMLGFSISTFGYVSQSEIKKIYAILDKQHKEHPGWATVELSGSSIYIGNLLYYIGIWSAFYNYDLEKIAHIGPKIKNKIELILLNEKLLEEYGYIYDREREKIVKK